MLKKLRRKFIATAMAASFIVFALLVTGINLMYRHITLDNMDRMLALIAENGGEPPRFDMRPEDRNPQRRASPWELDVTPETPFDTRFFSVWQSAEDGGTEAELAHIAAVSDEEAGEYYAAAEKTGRSSGFIDNYRFLKAEKDGRTLYVFLECSRQINNLRSLFYVSSLVALAALLVSFVLVIAISARALAPTARSIESQKQFITDVSHEIKTPLTVIASNAEIMCMEDGANEWAQGINREIGRIVSLVNDLVLLSRWDEESPFREKYVFDLSAAAWDTLTPYENLAKAAGKSFSVEIEEGLSVLGDEGAVQTALSTLLENAVKYSAPESEISFMLARSRRGICMELANLCAEGALPDLTRIFDRFYRADPSRSRASGGSGVGLSIARAIIEAHGGKISAFIREKNEVCFRVTLPEHAEK